MTNIEKLCKSLITTGTDGTNPKVELMFASTPLDEILTLHWRLKMSLGRPVVEATLHTNDGRALYWAVDRNPDTFSISIEACEAIARQSYKVDDDRTTETVKQIVKVLGYLD